MSGITKRVRELRNNQTKAEEIHREQVRKNQLGKKFLRQKPLIFFDGKIKRYFIADFLCNEATLVVEVDGKIHDQQKDYDQARDFVINKLGLFVLRVKNEDVFNDIDKVVDRIKEYL